MIKTQKLFTMLMIASTMTAASLQSCNTAESSDSLDGIEANALEDVDSEEMEASADSYEDESSLTDTGSENWDQTLDDYEAYVTEYIEFSKKAAKGDASAMAQYPALMEKAGELEKSLQKAEKDNNLSVEQMTRMTKIQAKMLEGVSEITKGASQMIGG